MDGEQIYFNEEVNGDKLLVTSEIVAFKGTRLNTLDIEYATAWSSQTSVNALPTQALYGFSVGAHGKFIRVQFQKVGGLFWLGKGQYSRARSAIVSAVGARLIGEALNKLIRREELVFQHKVRGFAKDSRITLSSTGIRIEQTGVLFNKDFICTWSDLRLNHSNGWSFFKGYSTGRKAKLPTWNMPNNVVFLGLTNYLLDAANYRIFEKQVIASEMRTSN